MPINSPWRRAWLPTTDSGLEDSMDCTVIGVSKVGHDWATFTYFTINSNWIFTKYQFSWFSSVAQSCPTLCDPMDCSMPGFPVHHQLPELLKLMSIESTMPYNHFILCCPLLFPPSIIPSIRVFSNESVLPIRWPRYWSFSFNISPHSGLIPFRMDWLDLLAVQGTLKSLLQHHSFSLLLSDSTSQYYLPTSVPPFSLFPWLQFF